MSEKRKDSKGRILNKGESQRKDGTYEYKFVDKDRRRKSVYAPTLKKLREKEKEVVKNQLNGKLNIANKITLADCCNAFIFSKKVKPRTRETNQYLLKTIGKYPLAQMEIGKITDVDCELFNVQIARDYAETTCKQIGILLKGCFEYAIKKHFAINNYYIDIDWRCYECGGGYNTDALTKEEYELFLNFVEHDLTYAWYSPHIRFLKEAGLRVSEFIALAFEDIDFENKLLRVHRQLPTNNGKITNLKTPTSHNRIPLTSEAVQALKELIGRCYNPIETTDWSGETIHLFVLSKRGKLYTREAFDHLFQRINHAYNEHLNRSVRITPHVLRHTCATHMLLDGVSIPTVQRILRHSSPETTLTIYTQIQEKDLVNELSRVYDKNYDKKSPA